MARYPMLGLLLMVQCLMPNLLLMMQCPNLLYWAGAQATSHAQPASDSLVPNGQPVFDGPAQLIFGTSVWVSSAGVSNIVAPHVSCMPGMGYPFGLNPCCCPS